jgi:hypothetical protein
MIIISYVLQNRDLLKFSCLNFSFLSSDGYSIYAILKLQISFIAISVGAIYNFENKKTVRQSTNPTKSYLCWHKDN